MAKNKNGTVNIEISGDEMAVVAFVTPPHGDGKPAEFEDLKKILQETNLLHGVRDTGILRTHMENGKLHAVNFEVATGTKPTEGTDDEIDYLWREEIPEHLKEDVEDTRVDLRELDSVITVYKDQVIARIIPGEPGKPGKTVSGKTVPPEPGKKVSIKPGDNVKLSNDGLEFISTIDGAPRIENNRLTVDPVYTVKGNVDYSTGNLNFAGSIEIGGDVMDGFVVKAGGDIVIGGNVQAAAVIAGGDVWVKGGIITRNEGYVTAEGNVRAKYIENSIVEAEGDVTSDRAIINSFVRANGSVVCTSGEGKIIGGDVIAFNEINARTLGTSQETATILRAGYNFKAFLEINQRKQELAKVDFDLDDAKKSVASAEKDPSLAVNIHKVKEKISRLESAQEQLRSEIDILKSKSPLNNSAVIRSQETLHPGSIAHMGSAKLKVKSAMRFAALTVDKDDNINLAAYDTFTPKAKETLKPPPKQEKDDKKTTEEKPAAKKEEEKKAIRPNYGQPTVLVVENSNFYAERLQKILINSNFDVVGIAPDSKEAVRMYTKLRPNVVTVDIRLPNTDGITVIKHIKRLNPKANLIIVVSEGEDAKIAEAKLAGAKDFLVKPFTAGKIVEVMIRVLEKK